MRSDSETVQVNMQISLAGDFGSNGPPGKDLDAERPSNFKRFVLRYI